MPKRLLQRCAPDSIAEFRGASAVRIEDARRLVAQDRRTAAIYLFGYAAEMTLKAAYFRLIKFAPARPITLLDLNDALKTAVKFRIHWPPGGKLHNIECWALLLVAHRHFLGVPYKALDFQQRLLGDARTIYQGWRESIRYHKNIAYPHELERIAKAAEWLIANASKL